MIIDAIIRTVVSARARLYRGVGLFVIVSAVLIGMSASNVLGAVYLTGTKDANYSLFGTLDVENLVYHVVNEYAASYTALAAKGQQLYGASGTALYLLDSQGTPSVYGDVEAIITGTAFAPDGTFYATDKTESWFGTISEQPTVFTPIGQVNSNPSFNFYGSLACVNGNYYQTRDGTSSSTATLMLIDPDTGVGAQLGAINDLFSQMILFNYNDRLLGISSNPSTFAHLYEINITTDYSVTDLGLITGSLMPQSPLGGFTGAVNVVPEPATITLLAAGGVALLKRKFKG